MSPIPDESDSAVTLSERISDLAGTEEDGEDNESPVLVWPLS